MRYLVKCGLAATAIAAMVGALAAQDRGSDLAAVPGQVPDVQSVTVEAAARGVQPNAVLLVEVTRGPNLPEAFDYPYEAGDVRVNDVGREGDRKARDGIYTGRFNFDRARFRQEVQANAQQLRAKSGNLTAAPVLSTRFTPLATRRAAAAAPAAAEIQRVSARQLAADKVLRESVARDIRRIDRLLTPAEPQPGAPIFKIERGTAGDVRAEIAGRRVPIGLFNAATVNPSDVVPGRSLMITDTAVVNDPVRTFDLCQNTGNPNGIWTFKHLVTQMANTSQTGITPQAFVERWLTLSGFAQEANNFIAPPRPNYVAMVRDAWMAQSGGTTLDLNKAPFRLLAIVARPDLGAAPSGYGGGSAGEARFVFGVVDPNNPCGAEQSTVIFEYGINKASCSAKKGWIQSWFNLSNSGLVLGGTYNQALETITQQFVSANANPGQLPNRNAISQIRTNDLIGGPWTLFEYRLIPAGSADAGHLDLVTVKQTPDDSFRTQAARIVMLRDWINANQASLLANSFTVPTTLPNMHPFLGAEAPTFNNLSFTWTTTPFSPAVNATALANFSVATCNGCHTGDTATQFTHVKPRLQSSPAALSQFLNFTGSNHQNVQDDLERRQVFMANALNASCLALPIQRLPVAFVH